MATRTMNQEKHIFLLSPVLCNMPSLWAVGKDKQMDTNYKQEADDPGRIFCRFQRGGKNDRKMHLAFRSPGGAPLRVSVCQTYYEYMYPRNASDSVCSPEWKMCHPNKNQLNTCFMKFHQKTEQFQNFIKKSKTNFPVTITFEIFVQCEF
jgi:hypothetical protein